MKSFSSVIKSGTFIAGVEYELFIMIMVQVL